MSNSSSSDAQGRRQTSSSGQPIDRPRWAYVTRRTLHAALQIAAEIIASRDLELHELAAAPGRPIVLAPDRTRRAISSSPSAGKPPLRLLGIELAEAEAIVAQRRRDREVSAKPPAGSALELSPTTAPPAHTKPEASRTSGTPSAFRRSAQSDGDDPGICTCETPVPSPMWGPARCYTCGGEVLNAQP